MRCSAPSLPTLQVLKRLLSLQCPGLREEKQIPMVRFWHLALRLFAPDLALTKQPRIRQGRNDRRYLRRRKDGQKGVQKMGRRGVACGSSLSYYFDFDMSVFLPTVCSHCFHAMRPPSSGTRHLLCRYVVQARDPQRLPYFPPPQAIPGPPEPRCFALGQ